MKALITNGQGGASVEEVDTPQPGEGEILVKVSYVAQNPTDWKNMASAKSAGAIIGCDFAGTIADANGSKWREGQRVAGWVHGLWREPPRGAFAEYLVTESSLVYAVPEGVSDQQAAVVALAFATAVQALFQRLQLPEPSRPAKSAIPVLVNGGTSSVGKYAVQLAKLAGLFVVATGSRKNHDLLQSLGADATVDYADADWPAQVRQLTHDGLQHAFDCISEKGTVQAVAQALSPTKGGHVVTLLPVVEVRDSGEVDTAKVKLESTIVYTVFGHRLPYDKVFDNCGEPRPDDKAFWEKYLAMLPDMLSSGRIKPNRVRELGGLDSILDGFQQQEEGKVSAEKLVYKIA